MINITLKDGSVRQVEKGSTILEVAKSIHRGLAKEAIVGKVDGEIQPLNYELDKDSELEILTFEDKEAAAVFHHTSAHILAQAVKNLFGDVRLGIGPAIDNGFYYDFDLEHKFT